VLVVPHCAPHDVLSVSRLVDIHNATWKFSCNVSNPAQNRSLWPVMVDCRRCGTRDVPRSLRRPRTPVTEQFPPMGESEGRSMEPVLRPFCSRLRRRLAFIADLLRKLLVILTPEALEVPSQRMCPFCGLITSRHKTSCLECGKSLTPA
jgi:hypothetical protein